MREKSFKAKVCPVSKVLMIFLDARIPILAGVVDHWQSSAIVGWQVISRDGLVELIHVVFVEEHLKVSRNAH